LKACGSADNWRESLETDDFSSNRQPSPSPHFRVIFFSENDVPEVEARRWSGRHGPARRLF
jgi:hypothetical protein